MTAFDRRLDPASRAPIAVAVSGGADSILALRRTMDWARAHSRSVIALSVDHRLQPQSAIWSVQACEAARALGAQAEVLTWRGAPPPTGLADAARTARHILLAEAARAAGATVIVTGHTASDNLENAALGQGALREWSPSPVWPQGRDIFLLRPLLALSRAAVRLALRAEGGRWIDDPTNDDLARPRARARRALDEQSAIEAGPAPDAACAALARLVRFEAGLILIPRAPFSAVNPAVRRRVLGAAVVSAGGGSGVPRSARLAALGERLASNEPVHATLSGARIQAGEDIAVWRNAGEAARGGLKPLDLAPGGTGVWDGRYEMALEKGGRIAALRGLTAQLTPADRRRLAVWDAAVRPALPVILPPNGTMACPILASETSPWVRWLVPARFAAACDLIAHERVFNERMAKPSGPSYVETGLAHGTRL